MFTGVLRKSAEPEPGYFPESGVDIETIPKFAFAKDAEPEQEYFFLTGGGAGGEIEIIQCWVQSGSAFTSLEQESSEIILAPHPRF